MSAAGIDPLDALAAQQTAPVVAGGIDPLDAMAMGKPVPVSAPIAPAASTGWADPKGYLSSIVRNAANAASFNLADPITAALGAATPVPGWTEPKTPNADWDSFGKRYDKLLAINRANTAAGEKANPVTSLAASIAGGVVNPANYVLPVPPSMGAAALQGAGMGAAYGAGGSMGTAKTPGQALGDVLMGAGTGAIAGPVAYGLGKVLTGATRSPAAQLLTDEGVTLTPGQSLGGTAQTIEDASTHIPMLGNAIKGRQFDAVMDFNKAAYNRVLEPLGVEFDEDAPVGNEGIQKLGGIINDAYSKAYDGAAVKNTDAFQDALSGIKQDAASALPAERASMIGKNIERLITDKMGAGGQLQGDDLQAAKNWFAEQARPSPTASLDDRATAAAATKVVDALKDGIAETDPERGAMLDAADNAYMRYARVAQAAGSNNASAKGGIFTASQLGNALRSMDTSTRRMNFAKGLAPMQDLAQAGQQVLPSTVPDSGTALRGLIELGAGGAITHSIAPEAALPALGAIGAGTALYSKPGQKLAEALLFGAPGARSAMGKIPMTMMPGVLAALGANNANKP